MPDLKAMRAAIARLAPASDLSIRRCAVLVPTSGAKEELRRYLENTAIAAGSAALWLPDLVTRAAFYRSIHAAVDGAPPLLTDAEREVLLRRAAREAIAVGGAPPFRLRAGLIVQMLDFYDELRRREQSLDDLERHATERLSASAAYDRGAQRLLDQTRFLCAAYARFERMTLETRCIDEHGLRAMLLGDDLLSGMPYDHVVITIADQAADPRGLYASDFDLLTRVAGISRIDVLATENTLAAGFHERIHHFLPNLVEERFGEPSLPPVLAVPEGSVPGERWFKSRDREEELAAIVRALKGRTTSTHPDHRPPPLDRIGVVFQRPLPYLYLAKQVFADGGVPYDALDRLPLAGEPFAAAIDILLSVIASEANRASIIELLSSPHFTFRDALGYREIAALDDRLKEAKYAGGWDRLAQPWPDDPGGRPRAGDKALETANDVARALQPVVNAPSVSAQLEALLSFIRAFEPAPIAGAELGDRHARSRIAILAILETLRDAHHRHDDHPMEITELSGSVRRWIEAETSSNRTGGNGLRLLDAASAAYADLDELLLLGLVEDDWPEPVRRSIFYPSSILSNLGWSVDTLRLTSERARFRDLLRSATTRVSASVFTLEEDALVAPSALLEELETADLRIELSPVARPAQVFLHEAMQTGSVDRVAEAGAMTAAEWLSLRASRTSTTDPRFKGSTGTREPQTYAVSYLERYLDCPFKYFAARVLRLPEERDDESGLTPIERGHFIHDVFETFFREWQRAGRGSITIANVAEALDLFEMVAERKLDALPQGDQALERTHLLGSAAAPGLGERAFAFEIEHGGEVVERLLEHELEGEFTFAGADGPRRVRIKAKADRLDLMADGTIRVIDYKLGKAPKPARALQLPIYGVIAQQALEGHRGRSWTVATAGYVAFKEKDPFVPLGGRAGQLAAAIAEGQQRLLTAIDAIERGEFPVQPEEPFRCQWCGYAGVCRKDYVGDE